MNSDETSLVIMERAAVLLAEANTIQQAKDLKTLALTAEDWAKRKGLGIETERRCHAYALRAEIKMGEMLRATNGERAKGSAEPGMGRRGKINAVLQEYRIPRTPTLADLGLTKNESSRAQRLAALPPDKQEAVVLGKLSPTSVLREPPDNTGRPHRSKKVVDPLRYALEEGRLWMVKWKHLNALSPVFLELTELIGRYGGMK